MYFYIYREIVITWFNCIHSHKAFTLYEWSDCITNLRRWRVSITCRKGWYSKLTKVIGSLSRSLLWLRKLPRSSWRHSGSSHYNATYRATARVSSTPWPWCLKQHRRTVDNQLMSVLQTHAARKEYTGRVTHKRYSASSLSLTVSKYTRKVQRFEDTPFKRV